MCCWLDGHFSGGSTFQGTKISPIREELSIIQRYIHKFNKIVVLIDDVYDFYDDPESYPPLNYYVEWSTENNLNWIIEHGIFISKSKNLEI